MRAQAPPKSPVASLLEIVRPGVESRLQQLFHRLDLDAREVAPEALPVLHAARDLTLRGGKRLRAALVFAAIECVEPGAYTQVAFEVGTALELLQGWLLAHDDWMDGSNTRRGAATAHIALALRYGDAHRGACGAILAGDLLSALTHEIMGTIDLPAARRRDLVLAFARMEREVLLGQCLDMDQCDDAWRVYDLKTSAYSVRGPLLLGAAIVGANEKIRHILTAYAEPLGRAFQLRDDLLDLFGFQERTGKSRGSDLREGKATPLLAHARAHLCDADRTQLGAIVGQRDASDADIAHACALIERSGARSRFEQEVHTLRERSLTALHGSSLQPHGLRLLEEFAETLTTRSL
jgi:geranylgeranyl diphosphate synthase, type I